MKRLVSLVLVVCLSLALCLPAALAEESATVKTLVKGGSLHLRASATTDSATNGYVKDGDAISVLSKGDLWSQVRATKSGKTGYIKNIYIVYGSSPAPTMEKGKNVYVSESGGSLKVRAGQGTNYSVKGYVNHGDAIKLLKVYDEWSKIRVTKSGVEGYIKNIYIYGYGTAGWSYVEEENAPSPSSYDAGNVVTKNAGSTVNLRAEASSSSKKVGSLSQGAFLKITGSSGRWYKVTTKSGKTGYVSKSYVALGASAKTTASLNVRKSASSSSGKLTTLSKGASVTILSVSGNWAQIHYSGNKTGYVSMNYLAY